jgi:4-amino-4-deoxy-L-arabinose transferase-like glycosyltransferase
LLVLALAYLAIGIGQAANDAPAVDEGVDVSSSVAALVRHDLRMNPEHPPLGRVLSALPALQADPVVPDTEAYRDGDWFDWSDDFISANEDAGRLRPLIFRARIVVLLMGLACGLAIYALAARFFGPVGGLLSAGAWLTTPYVVGISHFAMTDVPFTLVTLLVSLALVRWLDRRTFAAAGLVGLALGAGLATRHTGLVLVLVAVAVMAVVLRREPRLAVQQVIVSGVVAVVAVWLVYRGIAPRGPDGAVADRFDGLIAASSGRSLTSRLLTSLPLPLEWRAGYAFLDLSPTDTRSSLFGRSWVGSRWWYFPASALVKVPLPMVAATVAGWVVAVRSPRVERRALALTVALPGVAMWLLLLAQPFNRGLRMALPVVALAFVGVGGLALVLQHLAARVAVGLVVVAQVVAMAVAAPHSLAWTPPPWQPAYRSVSDANLDAGQALHDVRSWARTRDRPFVALDSTRGLAVGEGSRSLREVEPDEVRGWVAVGVTPLMQTRFEELAWLRKYCPVATLGGGSVLVYRFDDAPSSAPGPERPVSPCFGDAVSTDRS